MVTETVWNSAGHQHFDPRKIDLGGMEMRIQDEDSILVMHGVHSWELNKNILDGACNQKHFPRTYLGDYNLVRYHNSDSLMKGGKAVEKNCVHLFSFDGY